MQVLIRYFRNIRGHVGLLRQGGADNPAMLVMQNLCGEIEQTLDRCLTLRAQIDRLQ